MKEDEIDMLFKDLRGSFDAQEPAHGHQQRFLDRLNDQDSQRSAKKRFPWMSLSIAASILVVVGLTFGQFLFTPSMDEQVAKISPEIGQTQFYFTNLVEEQVKELQALKSPETERIIGDAMIQIKALEDDFSTLEKELIKGGNSKLILSAMITNFQTRIDLLEAVLAQIETITSLKNNTDEKQII
jgi:hypothetical protein